MNCIFADHLKVAMFVYERSVLQDNRSSRSPIIFDIATMIQYVVDTYCLYSIVFAGIFSFKRQSPKRFCISVIRAFLNFGQRHLKSVEVDSTIIVC